MHQLLGFQTGTAPNITTSVTMRFERTCEYSTCTAPLNLHRMSEQVCTGQKAHCEILLSCRLQTVKREPWANLL